VAQIPNFKHYEQAYYSRRFTVVAVTNIRQIPFWLFTKAIHKKQCASLCMVNEKYFAVTVLCKVQRSLRNLLHSTVTML